MDPYKYHGLKTDPYEDQEPETDPNEDGPETDPQKIKGRFRISIKVVG